MVERLSKRYGLSESVTSQMLQIHEDHVRCGEHFLKDDVYAVTVVKRETDFDLKLFRASITEYRRDGV